MIESLLANALTVHRSSSLALKHFERRPIPRPARTVRPQAHGSHDVSRFYEGSVYTLGGYVRGDTAHAALEALAELRAELAIGSSIVLTYVYEGDTETYQATVKQASEFSAALEGSRRIIEWTVELFASDPREYSSSVSAASYDPTVLGSSRGMTLPAVFPIVWAGGSSSAGVLEVVNLGTFATPPAYIIDGPADDPVITNETTGDVITTSGLSLAVGETATIDVASRDLLLLGTTSRPDLIDPAGTNWSDLPAGTSRFRMSGSSFSAGETRLTVQHRNARI